MPRKSGGKSFGTRGRPSPKSHQDTLKVERPGDSAPFSKDSGSSRKAGGGDQASRGKGAVKSNMRDLRVPVRSMSSLPIANRSGSKFTPVSPDNAPQEAKSTSRGKT